MYIQRAIDFMFTTNLIENIMDAKIKKKKITIASKVMLYEDKLANKVNYGETENEIVGYHQVNGHEFEQTLGDCEGQGSLACCSLMGLRESNMT